MLAIFPAMKQFFASLLGTLTGLLLFCVVASLLVVIGIGVIASMEQPTPNVKKGSYLYFDLDANITDAPPPYESGGMPAFFGGSGPETLQLRGVTRALRAAATDDRIKGIFMKGKLQPDGYGSGYAALAEVRAALKDFRASGKPIVAYVDDAAVRDFYLESAASDIALDPYGTLYLPGLASEPMFFAGAFERFGIGVQVTRVGKYKAAVEPFIRRDMSPENREELTKLLGGIWEELRSGIAGGRDLSPEALQKIVDDEGIVRPEIALKTGLVTRTAYYDEVVADLKKATDSEDDDTFKQVELADYIKTLPAGTKVATDGATKPGHGHGKIAVVYAEGAIVDGEGKTGEVGGDKYAREIRKLRDDDDVAAIVLRVNSPGGSATAAEHIQRELRLAKEKKPVIVSMGSYAASGGYWISAYADRIYAEPSTITGSIGVFGMQFDVQKLANDLGITFDSVKTGRFADTFTLSRPKTPEEMAMLQRLVDWIYDEFIRKVSEGRNLNPDKVREIAQGRVWSGRDALGLGLVDEIGGFDEALAHAASVAGLADGFSVKEFPRTKPLVEAIQDMIGGKKQEADDASLPSQVKNRMQAEAQVLSEFNDRRGLYARLPLELTLP